MEVELIFTATYIELYNVSDDKQRFTKVREWTLAIMMPMMLMARTIMKKRVIIKVVLVNEHGH